MQNSRLWKKTCTQTGYVKNTCSACAHEWETNILPATGHVWGNPEPLEIQDGKYYHQLTCSNCEETTTQLCTEKENYTQANCTEPSHRTFKCDVCLRLREDETDVQQALGHIVYVYNHFEQNGTHKHTYKCNRCKQQFTDDCRFTSDETKSKAPTCTQPGVTVEFCEVCKFVKSTTGQTTPHDWTNYSRKTDSSHYRVCNKCNTTEVVPCSFEVLNVEQVSCTEKEKTTYKCSFCLQQKTLVTKHELGHLFPSTVEENPSLWQITDGKHTRKCARCNKTETLSHNFSDSNLCKICGYDGLTYEVVNGHAICYENTNCKYSKNLIIANEYEGVPVTVVESRLNRSTGTYKGFYNNGFIRTIVLPQTIEEIGESCFARCGNLTSVSIAGENEEGFNPSLKRILDSAFAYCYSLTTAKNLPNGLVHIGNRAFYDCTSLNEISIPDTVLEIGDHAFTNSGYLNNLGENSVVYVGNHLLKVSTQKKGDFEIASSTISIAAEAFKDCEYLTKIIMHENVKEIGQDAFLGCNLLEAVEYKGSFEQWFGIVFENDNSSPMSHASSLHIAGASGTVKIPYGTTKIPAGTFKGTAVEKIEIPDTVTYIGEEAFENCSMLNEITFFDKSGEVSTKRNWQFIGKNAFNGTSILSADDFGVKYFDVYLIDGTALNTADYTVKAGTISIASEAFLNCEKLESITFASSLNYIGAHAFVGCDNMTFLKFEDATNWFAWTYFNLGRTISQSAIDGSDSTKAQDMCGQIRDFYNGDWKKSQPAT